MSEATVTAAMTGELRFLLFLAPLEARRANRAQNRIHAEKLDRALHEVEKLLTSAPNPLRLFLLNPLPMMTEWGGLMPKKTPSIEDVERANRKAADFLSAELKRLRQVCARAVGSGFGYHANYDPAKYFCAFSAYGWMKGYSDGPITTTADGAFRIITSLAYEAISGLEVDLKRACDSCLRKSGEPPS